MENPLEQTNNLAQEAEAALVQELSNPNIQNSLDEIIKRSLLISGTKEKAVRMLMRLRPDSNPNVITAMVGVVWERMQRHPSERQEHDKKEANRDYNHAETLAEAFQGKYRWAHHLGRWFQYDGTEWREIPEELMARISAAELQKIYAQKITDAVAAGENGGRIKDLSAMLNGAYWYRYIRGALSFLKGFDGFYTEIKSWDANPWLLNVRNGTLDLETGKLLSHNPSDLITKIANVKYDPTATAPEWEKHLTKFLPDADVRRQVQRDLGMSLPGAVLEESLPIWYGTGANGKSTTARVIMDILGDYAKRAAPNLLIQKKYEEHPTGLADLVGARLVFSVEVDQDRKLAESLVKELTGGDRKKARRMRQDFFEFEQTFSIVLIANHKPIIQGTDTAIWRRVRLVPWTVMLPETERLPQDKVVQILKQEASGILNWMLRGLKDKMENPHWIALQVQTATEEYRVEQDLY